MAGFTQNCLHIRGFWVIFGSKWPRRAADRAAGRVCERSKKENFAWSPSFGRVVTRLRRSAVGDGLRQRRCVVGLFSA
jgi:hypothetical protein